MTEKAVPMIHVPDVRATVEWYQGIGFNVRNTYGNDEGGLSFAILSFGNSEVMFNQGGKPSTAFRREVDLYVYTDNVDEIYESLKDRVDVIERPHDQFYGMREVTIRDLNRFWVTFGQPSTFESLLTAAHENNLELVRTTLKNGEVKPETLTAGLALALSSENSGPEIPELLKAAGAIPPHDVDVETLQSYAGTYSREGFEINVTFREGKLFAAVGKEQPMILFAVDSVRFRPIAWDNYGTLIFKIVEGKTVGCVVKHDSGETELKRV